MIFCLEDETPFFFSSDYIIVKVHSLDRDVSGNSVVLTKNTLITNAGNSFKLFIILLKKYFFFQPIYFTSPFVNEKLKVVQRFLLQSWPQLSSIILLLGGSHAFIFQEKNIRKTGKIADFSMISKPRYLCSWAP